MAIKIGDTIPSATLKRKDAEGVKDITTDQIFKGRKVVLFGVPGAFTPTCSGKHLPGFIGHAAEIKAKGVDTIACVAVNDAFVMEAWGQQQGAGGKVMMLADGNGEFTRALGLELDARGFGMGARSRRYAMVVEDGKVTKLAVEESPGLSVSSAERILEQL